MTYTVTCQCGATLSDDDRDTLIERVREHASAQHDLELTDEQIEAMIRTRV